MVCRQLQRSPLAEQGGSRLQGLQAVLRRHHRFALQQLGAGLQGQHALQFGVQLGVLAVGAAQRVQGGR